MPSKRSARDRLSHIRHYIYLTGNMIADHDYESFLADTKTSLATIYCLQIISEASRHLPDDIKARHPHINWRGLGDASNIYRHEYDNVAPNQVWNAIKERLPELLAVVEEELNLTTSPAPTPKPNL